MLPEAIADGVGVDPEFVNATANRASLLYRTFKIPKRGGGFRTIHHPAPELKALQRFLSRNIFKTLRVHGAATAYERGSTISHNAEVHAGSRFLLRMDFSNFFPSIRAEDVRAFLDQHRGQLGDDWSDSDTQTATNLCCRFGALTIGAVTSPFLSNRICLALDERIHGECQQTGVTYSRYADDLFFSTRRPGVLSEIESRVHRIVDEIGCPGALAINRKKTRHLSKKRKRVVTGLVLTSDGRVSIGRPLKRRIRGAIHRLDSLSEEESGWLRGIVAHTYGVEPEFVSRLYVKFGSETLDRVLRNPAMISDP